VSHADDSPGKTKFKRGCRILLSGGGGETENQEPFNTARANDTFKGVLFVSGKSISCKSAFESSENVYLRVS
jgi:hypothetical protein